MVLRGYGLIAPGAGWLLSLIQLHMRSLSLLEFRAVPAKKKRALSQLIRRLFRRSLPFPTPLGAEQTCIQDSGKRRFLIVSRGRPNRGVAQTEPLGSIRVVNRGTTEVNGVRVAQASLVMSARAACTSGDAWSSVCLLPFPRGFLLAASSLYFASRTSCQ